MKSVNLGAAAYSFQNLSTRAPMESENTVSTLGLGDIMTLVTSIWMTQQVINRNLQLRRIQHFFLFESVYAQ